METSWGKEAMVFVRTELPAILSDYKGKPEGLMSELDKRWRARLKLLAKRFDGMDKDDPEHPLELSMADQRLVAARVASAEKAKEPEAKPAKGGSKGGSKGTTSDGAK